MAGSILVTHGKIIHANQVLGLKTLNETSRFLVL